MEILCNQSLKNYSTFKIGGTADYLLEFKTLEEALYALEFAKEKKIPWFVIGKGSNCLFPDTPFKGLVLVNNIQFFFQQNEIFKVGAGFSFSYLGAKTAQLGYSGLEFASGIPGSVGGAIYMNAGASMMETKDPLLEVEFLNENGCLETFQKNQMQFSYRKSSFQLKKGIIISAQFQLTANPKAKEIQQKILAGRVKSQPYQDPSIGCFFKNPSKEMPAGKLIDECGLKGLKIGGASVSTVHANFIVNQNGASHQDVILLKQLIKHKVYEKSGIHLEEEVQIFEEFTI